MRHLADVEIVDLIENALAPDRARHAEDCRECRERADALRAALAHAAAVEVPEPSPLFWQHFSGRVRERVQQAEIDRFGGWFAWLEGPAIKWAFSGALVALVIVAGILTIGRSRHSDEPTTLSSAAPGSQAVPGDAAPSPADIDSDEAWGLVRAAADDASWEDAVGAGVASGPGQAERVALTLTPDERLELLQLLRAETKRPGA